MFRLILVKIRYDKVKTVPYRQVKANRGRITGHPVSYHLRQVKKHKEMMNKKAFNVLCSDSPI